MSLSEIKAIIRPPAINYRQTLGISQAIGDRQGEASALNHLGRAYLALGNYDSAQTYIEQAFPIYYSIDDQAGLGETLGVMSAIYHSLAKYDVAQLTAQQALDIFENLDSQIYRAKAQLPLSLALEALDDLDAARESYQQTLTSQLAVGDESSALETRAGLARCFMAQNKLFEALPPIQEGLAWLDENSLSGSINRFRFIWPPIGC